MANPVGGRIRSRSIRGHHLWHGCKSDRVGGSSIVWVVGAGYVEKRCWGLDDDEDGLAAMACWRRYEDFELVLWLAIEGTIVWKRFVCLGYVVFLNKIEDREVKTRCQMS